MLQTHGKFMKCVLFTLQEMTPEPMKMSPIKPIIKVKTNEELEKEEGESIKDEEKHLKNCQKNKMLHLTYILKIQKMHIQLKHLKFIMF